VKKLVLIFLFMCFVLSGCGGERIICRPASEVGSFSGEKGMITIAWDSNIKPNLAGYRIYYGMASGKYKNCIDIGKLSESSPGVTKYTLTGLSVGKIYFISVVAYDITKKSLGFSQEVSGVVKWFE